MSAQIYPLTSPMMRALLLACALAPACGVSSTLVAPDENMGNTNTLFNTAGNTDSASADQLPTTTTTTQTSEASLLGTVVNGTFVLSPSLDLGPNWVEDARKRSDVTSDPVSGVVQQGAPMALNLTVYQVSQNVASVLTGIKVYLWQANASGVFSEENSQSTTFEAWLRGYQATDSQGQAGFTSIVPGWYAGTAPHVHIRVRDNQGFDWYTQLFFQDSDLSQIYTQAPYDQHTGQDTFLTSDPAYTTSCSQDANSFPCGQLSMLTVSQDGNGGIIATANLYLNLDGQ